MVNHLLHKVHLDGAKLLRNAGIVDLDLGHRRLLAAGTGADMSARKGAGNLNATGRPEGGGGQPVSGEEGHGGWYFSLLLFDDVLNSDLLLDFVGLRMCFPRTWSSHHLIVVVLAGGLGLVVLEHELERALLLGANLHSSCPESGLNGKK